MSLDPLRIAWIDGHRLTRECIMTALIGLQPSLTIDPYDSLEDCVAAAPPSDWGLILYYAHNVVTDLPEAISTLQRAFQSAPIVLLSDAGEDSQIRAIRDALGSGAKGYICTRTSSILMALASLRFVEAGGTFAPLELLLTADPEAEDVIVAVKDTGDRLTPRQIDVLAEVRLGKANRTIAHDLGMSESAVKVHIRNIMRKMGAANRTQAAFKAQEQDREDRGDGNDAEPSHGVSEGAL